CSRITDTGTDLSSSRIAPDTEARIPRPLLRQPRTPLQAEGQARRGSLAAPTSATGANNSGIDAVPTNSPATPADDNEPRTLRASLSARAAHARATAITA